MKQLIEKIREKVHITCPFNLLMEKYLNVVVDLGLNLEIGLDKYGLTASIHGPFTDLPLGASNREVREAVGEVFKKALDVAKIFNSNTMVIHTGFDPKHHGTPNQEWLERAVHTLRSLLDLCQKSGPRLLVENTFEYDPWLIKGLFSIFPEDVLGFCFDLAHQKVFSKTSMDTWLHACGKRLGELHLHDNRGEQDEHLAVGQGSLDFQALFRWLVQNHKRPILTIEAHSEDAVIPAMLAVERLGIESGYFEP